MRRNESGVTMIGFLIMAVFLGLFALAIIKLLPVYLEYGKVQSTLSKVQTEFNEKSPSILEINKSIERRFDVEDVRRIRWQDVKVTREARSFKVHAVYEARVYFIGNLYLVAAFDTSVDIQR